MKLGTTLLTSKRALATIPAAFITTVVLWKVTAGFEQTTKHAADGLNGIVETSKSALMESGEKGLDHITEGVCAMCEVQQDIVQQKVNYDLNVARRVLQNTGPVTFTEDGVDWDAVNQYTKQSSPTTLPKMKVRDTWLGQNGSLSERSTIIEEVRDLVGGACTIFQRMNQAGDMLRI